MKSYIDLIDSKKININNLIDKVEPIQNAKQVYSSFEMKKRPISTLFKYSLKNKKTIQEKVSSIKKKLEYFIGNSRSRRFSNEVTIPNLLKMKNYNSLDYICVKKPISFLNSSSFYKDINIVNDFNSLIKNKSLDVVFISTRHNSHWQLTKKALLNKKHVFCEKPMCLTVNELNEIKSFFIKQKSPQFLSRDLIEDFLNLRKF